VRRVWAGEAGTAGAVSLLASAPAEWIFRAGVRARGAAYDRGWLAAERAPVPVISIGNLTVGGAGKTPFSAWVAGRLREWGHRPALAVRGYGPDEVEVHRALNPDVPVFVVPKRIEAARAASDAGRDVVVLDDGFQHRALARDLDVVLVPAEGWTDRPRLLPRGPWRESLAALRRAHAVVVTRKSASPETGARIADRLRTRFPTLFVAECHLAPGELVPLHGAASAGPPPGSGRVLAVAALAEPEPFAAQLGARGLEVDLAAYPDHHPFGAGDARELLRRTAGRPIIMTLKDAVKLRALLPLEHPAWVLPQTVRITAGREALETALKRAAAGERAA